MQIFIEQICIMSVEIISYNYSTVGISTRITASHELRIKLNSTLYDGGQYTYATINQLSGRDSRFGLREPIKL